MSISRKRPSSRPTIMPGKSRVARRSAASASRKAGGAVVCSVAYGLQGGIDDVGHALHRKAGGDGRWPSTGAGVAGPSAVYSQICSPSRTSPARS